MRDTPIYEVANRLADLMKQYSWYHRTSVAEWRPNPQSEWRSCLQVWGEKAGSQEAPVMFEGFKVQFCLVTKKKQCPFGSVKP